MLEEKLAEKNWSAVKICLATTATSGQERLQLSQLPESQRSGVQQKVIASLITDFAKQVGQHSQCWSFIGFLVKEQVVSSTPLVDELKHMDTIFQIARFTAAEESGSAIVNEGAFEAGDLQTPAVGQAACAYFKDHKDGNFFKGWQVYIVFVEAENTVMKFVRDSALDEHHINAVSELDKLQMVSILGPLDIDELRKRVTLGASTRESTWG